MSDDLSKIPYTIKLSRKTLSIIKQNIIIAIGIKAIFLTMGIMGIATLWMAVFADMGASLIVIFNGLELERREPGIRKRFSENLFVLPLRATPPLLPPQGGNGSVEGFPNLPKTFFKLLRLFWFRLKEEAASKLNYSVWQSICLFLCFFLFLQKKKEEKKEENGWKEVCDGSKVFQQSLKAERGFRSYEGGVCRNVYLRTHRL